LPGGNSLSWSEHSLQQKYFRTMQAGENFFIRLEEILQSENKENAIVYLLCLQHGFHGKYKIAAIEAKQQNETLLINDQQSIQQAHAINPLEVIITDAKQQLSSSINQEKTSSIKKPPAAIRYIICAACAIYIAANLAHSNIEAKRNLKKITTLTAVKTTAQRINHA
ncbi:MAG: DotU family type IV/VI secretion system protein, partial [Candidatus Thioglobus sp.]